MLAQDAEMLHYFDYDQKASLVIQESGVLWLQKGVTEDVTVRYTHHVHQAHQVGH